MVSKEDLKGYKIAVIGENPLASGMEIAGIKYSYRAANQAEAEASVKEVLEKKDIGIVVINKKVASMVKDRKLAKAIEASLLPIFVAVPSYGETSWEDDQLRKLIMRAIGIDIAAK